LDVIGFVRLISAAELIERVLDSIKCCAGHRSDLLTRAVTSEVIELAGCKTISSEAPLAARGLGISASLTIFAQRCNRLE
jgi:hypothetical protein